MSNRLYFDSDDEIAAIVSGLSSLTLPKERWTHAAHFATALWLLQRYPEAYVISTVRRLICAYKVACGGANTDTSGYHETITIASVRAAAAFLASREVMPLFRTCNELMESPLGRPGWLLQYWSRETLFSVRARRMWVDADVAPFPH